MGDKQSVTPVGKSGVTNQATLPRMAGVLLALTSSRGPAVAAFSLRDPQRRRGHFFNTNRKVEHTGQWQQTQRTCRGAAWAKNCRLVLCLENHPKKASFSVNNKQKVWGLSWRKDPKK